MPISSLAPCQLPNQIKVSFIHIKIHSCLFQNLQYVWWIKRWLAGCWFCSMHACSRYTGTPLAMFQSRSVHLPTSFLSRPNNGESTNIDSCILCKLLEWHIVFRVWYANINICICVHCFIHLDYLNSVDTTKYLFKLFLKTAQFCLFYLWISPVSIEFVLFDMGIYDISAESADTFCPAGMLSVAVSGSSNGI